MYEKLSSKTENMIDYPQMIIELEKIVESKTSRNFEGDYWGILSMSLWIAFSNWLQNKK